MTTRRRGLFATVFADRLRGLAPTIVIAQVLMGVLTIGWVAAWDDDRWYGPVMTFTEWLDMMVRQIPVEGVGWAVRLPWWVAAHGCLLWPLALPVSLWIVFSGRTIGGRALAAAVALAAAAVAAIVALALAGKTVPAAALASFEVWQALLVLALVAGGCAVLLFPLRRVARGPAIGAGAFASLMGWGLLTTQLSVFTISIGWQLGALLSSDPLPRLGGRYSELAVASADATRWPEAIAAVALLLVPAIVVLRGQSLLAALRSLGRAARRRPVGVIAATWHGILLGTVLFVLVSTLSALPFLEEDRITATYKAVLYSALAGLLLGVWVWLTGRFALALTDPGYLGRATQTISAPPSESGVPSKSP